MLKYTKLLTDRIEEAKGKPFNIALWVNFYTFDIMGDLSFGKSFDLLESGVEHHFFTESHKTQGFMGAFRRMVWFFPLVSSIPIVNKSYLAFQAYVRNQVETRRKVCIFEGRQYLTNRRRIHQRNQMFLAVFWRITMRLRSLLSRTSIIFVVMLISL